MRSPTCFSLMLDDAVLTVAADGPLAPGDADRLAALCLSLPDGIRSLCVDLTGAGLVGTDVLRRVSRIASGWRYARGTGVTLRFMASLDDASGLPLAERVPVEVKYPARHAARRRLAPLEPSAARGLGVFTVTPARLALQASA